MRYARQGPRVPAYFVAGFSSINIPPSTVKDLAVMYFHPRGGEEATISWA